MPLLELRDVVKTYRQGGLWSRRHSVTALSWVNLTIREGQCLALVGSSGSGKSTLGRLVLGLERPDSGSVLYKGKDLARLAGEERYRARRAVQVVFQNSHGAVNPRFNVLDIVGEPLRYAGIARGQALKNRIVDLLHMVGLDTNLLSRLPHQCSGGELQRVCLARALALEPELIVLDEAVSSLDMLNQKRVLDILSNIKETHGAAFLFISHDLRVVGRMADAVAIMQNGRIVTYNDAGDPSQQAMLATDTHFRLLASAILPAAPKAQDTV